MYLLRYCIKPCLSVALDPPEVCNLVVDLNGLRLLPLRLLEPTLDGVDVDVLLGALLLEDGGNLRLRDVEVGGTVLRIKEE